MWENNDIPKLIDTMTFGAQSVLDLGCGRGISTNLVNVPVKTGVDAFDYAKDFKYNTKEGMFIQEDIRKLRDLFKNDWADVILLWDVIEHLPKDDGRKLLADCEMVAKKQIVVFTPLGFYLQDKDPLGEQNPFQIHQSQWNPDDFLKRFYDVIIMKNYIKVNGQDVILAHKRIGG